MKKLLFIIPILLISCHSQKQVIEVPVETVKYQYIYNTKIDSIYEKDSIDRWRYGDTVFIYREHTKYKYLNITDTIIKIDTIPKVVKIETIKEVKINYIRWYQKIFMWLGCLVSLILIGYIIYKVKFK